jgi:flagellar basal-body rod protein FlgC
MTSEIMNAMSVSASGMRAQGTRLRVISENVANAETTGETPGADPYRRQTILFKNVLDKELGVNKVKVSDIDQDMKTELPVKYIPDHPAADERGYVKMPNVNTLIEIMDVREAQRSYEANIGIMEQSRAMAQQVVDMLR